MIRAAKNIQRSSPRISPNNAVFEDRRCTAVVNAAALIGIIIRQNAVIEYRSRTRIVDTARNIITNIAFNNDVVERHGGQVNKNAAANRGDVVGDCCTGDFGLGVCVNENAAATSTSRLKKPMIAFRFIHILNRVSLTDTVP